MSSRFRKTSRIPWGTLSTAAVALAVAFGRFRHPEQDWATRWGLVPQHFWQSADWASLVRPVSALFVHHDWVHLGANLVFFLLVARQVEHRLGSLKLLGLFLAAGALANMVTAWHLTESLAPIIGMSGAVSALLGAYLVLYPRARIGIILPLGLYWQMIRVSALALIGSWFGLQLLYTFLSAGVGAVAWWTHIAGFLLGSVIAVPVRFQTHTRTKTLNERYHG